MTSTGGRRARRTHTAAPRSGAWLAWGAAAAAVYLAAVAWGWSWPAPIRLLYDGYTPPAPYRWVHPPQSRAGSNERPSPGSGVIPFGAQGSASSSIATGDEQAVIVVPKGAFAPKRGEPSVVVRIDPLDAATVIDSPGTGLVYDSNAYRITATYTNSRDPAPLVGPVNIVLRYATGATVIQRAAGSEWVSLSPTTLPITFQIYGPTNDLGVFVAAGPPPHGLSFSGWAYRIVTIVLWLAVAVVAGLLVRDAVRRARRKGGRAAR